MENQIHQFDASLKQGQAAQNTFANAIEDAWGKCGSSVRNGDLSAKSTKCGDDLDFSSNIYGDKLGPTKYDGKPRQESFGEKDESVRQKKEAAVKEDYLRSIKKEKDANGDVNGDKKDAEGKGKEVKEGGPKSKAEGKDNQSGDNSGLTPMPDKEVKDGGPKSKLESNGHEAGDNSGLTPMPDKEVKDGGEKSVAKPGNKEQHETVKDQIKVFPGKGGPKSDKPDGAGTKVSERQADSDEFLL